MIEIREIDRSFFSLYDSVTMNIDVRSEYRIRRPDSGLGGLILEETPVEPYVKDLGVYEHAVDFEKEFDISDWRFYMAFDGEKPVGAMTVTDGNNEKINMLCGLKNACVLWDIRVADGYKRRGIGQRLFDSGVAGARADGYITMLIECQNNNVPACRFYHKQGAQLAKIDTMAYSFDEAIADEVQFVWRLEL